MNNNRKISIMFALLILLISNSYCNKSQNYVNPNNSNSGTIQNKAYNSEEHPVSNIPIKGTPLLKISTEKTVFSEYEPIAILVQYINGVNIQDSLYKIDRYSYERREFIIKDNDGNLIKRKPYHFGCGIEKFKYSVNPSDTFNFILHPSGYGEYINDTSLTLENQTYLPKGTYTLRIKLGEGYAKNFSPELTSNEIRFEVRKYNKADDLKISLINSGYKMVSTKTDSSVNIYPVYSFTDIDTINPNENFSSYIYNLYQQQLVDEYRKKKINYDLFIERLLFNMKRFKNSVYSENAVVSLLYISNSYKNPKIDINEIFNKPEFENSLVLELAGNRYLKSKFSY